jgi:hypothetical protein
MYVKNREFVLRHDVFFYLFFILWYIKKNELKSTPDIAIKFSACLY